MAPDNLISAYHMWKEKESGMLVLPTNLDKLLAYLNIVEYQKSASHISCVLLLNIFFQEWPCMASEI